MTNPRIIASKILSAVIVNHQSLSIVLPTLLQQQEQRGLIQELSYGVLRWYARLEALAKKLLQKPLKTQDQDIYFLILIGLYQLLYLNIPTHAAVSETVNAAKTIHKTWAAPLINGVLRNFLRNKDSLLQKIDTIPSAYYSHPAWIIQQLQQDWSEDWEKILSANNQHPPLSLRINQRKISRATYLEKLAAHSLSATIIPDTPFGILLETPVNVQQLPGFENGEVSVQDGASQLAASLLQLQSGQRVLDACAAPGGKTAHILETEPQLAEMIALDIEQPRLQKVQENLQRLALGGSNTQLVCGDALQPKHGGMENYLIAFY